MGDDHTSMAIKSRRATSINRPLTFSEFIYKYVLPPVSMYVRLRQPEVGKPQILARIRQYFSIENM
jgi:hypothetical protein